MDRRELICEDDGCSFYDGTSDSCGYERTVRSNAMLRLHTWQIAMHLSAKKWMTLNWLWLLFADLFFHVPVRVHALLGLVPGCLVIGTATIHLFLCSSPDTCRSTKSSFHELWDVGTLLLTLHRPVSDNIHSAAQTVGLGTWYLQSHLQLFDLHFPRASSSHQISQWQGKYSKASSINYSFCVQDFNAPCFLVLSTTPFIQRRLGPGYQYTASAEQAPRISFWNQHPSRTLTKYQNTEVPRIQVHSSKPENYSRRAKYISQAFLGAHRNSAPVFFSKNPRICRTLPCSAYFAVSFKFHLFTCSVLGAGDSDITFLSNSSSFTLTYWLLHVRAYHKLASTRSILYNLILLSCEPSRLKQDSVPSNDQTLPNSAGFGNSPHSRAWIFLLHVATPGRVYPFGERKETWKRKGERVRCLCV